MNNATRKIIRILKSKTGDNEHSITTKILTPPKILAPAASALCRIWDMPGALAVPARGLRQARVPPAPACCWSYVENAAEPSSYHKEQCMILGVAGF